MCYYSKNRYVFILVKKETIQGFNTQYFSHREKKNRQKSYNLDSCITTCKIKTDKNNTCKTCGMLITSPEFTSNLTGKTNYTKSLDPLDCSTKNVIYGIECTLCGLLYVGETRQSLQSRMNQHRYDARDPKYRICIIISINGS